MNLSVLDLGSSALRLATYHSTASGRLVRLGRAKEPLGLGRAVFDTGLMDEASLHEAVAALGRALAGARAAGANHVVAVTTSPPREAANGAALLERAWRDLGLRLEVLSGEDEAALAYRGARSEVGADAGRVTVIKLGNGTVELATGDGPQADLRASLPLGALRLRDQLGLDEAPLRARHVDLLRSRVKLGASRLAAEVRARGAGHLVLTSGTARAVAQLAAALPGGGHPGRVTLGDLHGVAYALAHAGGKARAALRAREPRLDTAGVGAVVAATLFELLHREEAAVVSVGFREGVALRELDRLRHNLGAAGPRLATATHAVAPAPAVLSA